MNHQDFLNEDMFYFSIDDGLPLLRKCRVFKILMEGRDVKYYVHPYRDGEINFNAMLIIDSYSCFPDHFEAAKCFNEAQDIFKLEVKPCQK
jgi:hypothetical protein